MTLPSLPRIDDPQKRSGQPREPQEQPLIGRPLRSLPDVERLSDDATGVHPGYETGGRASAHGRSASISAASPSSVTSSCGRPISCTDSGKPPGVNPAGTAAAG